MVILDQRVTKDHLAHQALPAFLVLALKWWREGTGL